MAENQPRKTSRDPKAGRDPRSEKPRGEEQQRRPKFMDIQIRSGIDNYWIRLPAKDYQKLVTWWMLAEETVVLRCVYSGAERNIVMRGGMSAHITVKPAEVGRKLPTFNLFRVADLQKEWLEQAGR